MPGFLIIPLIAALSTAGIERLIKYDDVRLQRKADAGAEARRNFAGRGKDVVGHFLKRGDYPPSGGAYIFVLTALGDVEATIRLIRALPDPPPYETGPVAKYGMGRDFGEVRWAIDDILESNNAMGKDPRVIDALIAAVESAKARPRKWASLGPEPLPPPVQVDPATAGRLLTSAVEVLGYEVTAFPKDGRQISYLTAQLTRDALWEVAGRNMAVAFSYADRIVPVSYRYTGSGRYGASLDLQRRDANAYREYRRPRQAGAALLLAPPFGILMFFRSSRRAAAVLIFSLLAWGVWSLFVSAVRELPPPPLYFFTVLFIAFAAAASFGAAVLAFVVCAWTRSQELFPIGGEGWELLFDPLESAILARASVFVLSVLDVYIFARIFRNKGAGEAYEK